MLLTNTQVSRLCKAFENNSSANINLSKTWLQKIGQSGRFLGLLLKAELSLIGNLLKPLAKSVLISLGLTAAASATDAAIHKKMFGCGFTILIISNEKMEDIIKIVKSLEDSGLLIKGNSETIKEEAKAQKRRISWNFIRHFRGASLIGNLSTVKVKIRAGENF